MTRATLLLAALRQALRAPAFVGPLREQLERDPQVLRVATAAVMVAERGRFFASSFRAALEGEPVDERRVALLTWAIAGELGTVLGAALARTRRAST